MHVETLIGQNLNSFVLCKVFPNSTGVISTFINNNNSITTDLTTPTSKLYRIKRMCEIIPHISSYTTNEETINFDCISPININTNIFQNSNFEKGIIHFDAISTSIQENNEDLEEYSINPRLIIKIQNQQVLSDLELTCENFKTEKIKIFSLIFIKGFILCLIDSKKTSLIFTYSDPIQKIAGITLLEDLKMIKNIIKIWPIFNIFKLNKVIRLTLKDNFPPIQSKYPKLISLQRNLDSNKIKISCNGQSVYIKV